MGAFPVISTGTLAGDGRATVTTAGTRVQLGVASGLGQVDCAYVKIQAETDNTGVIVGGGSTVVAALATRRGIALNAGEIDIIPCNHLNDVWLDTTVNTDGVTFQIFK